MILNEMKGHIRNAIGYLRERPFGQDKIDNATEEIKKAISCFDKEEIINENDVPYISTYFIEPKSNNGNLTFEYYVTDWNQKEYLENDDSQNFTIEYEIDDNKYTLENIKAGNNFLTLNNLSDGEHIISLQAVDRYGRKSHKLFNEILIKDDSDIKTYTITDDDLARYNINKNNSEVEEDLINNRIGLNQIMKDLSSNGYDKAILPNGIYRYLPIGEDDNGIRHNTTYAIKIPSNFTLDLNGSTIKQHVYEGQISEFIVFEDDYDSHLINGTLDGDYGEHNIINPTTGNRDWGEHCYAIDFIGGKYNTLENITIKNTVGYTTTSQIKNSCLLSWDKTMVNTDIIDGIEVESTNRTTTLNFIDLTKLLENNRKYIIASIYLGYSGMVSNSWIIDFHFFDENYNFIETIRGFQYRPTKIPNNAKYAKLTMHDLMTAETMDNLALYDFDCPVNTIVRNCNYVNTRTCAIATCQTRNILFENINFDNCGQNITPIAIDLEDGWYGTIDNTFRGLSFNNTTNDFLACSGHNIIVEDSQLLSPSFRGGWNGSRSAVFRNNTVNNALGISHGYHYLSAFHRVYNNNIIGGVYPRYYTSSYETDYLKLAIKNCTIQESNPEDSNIYYDNCIFDGSNFDVSTVVGAAYVTLSNCNIINSEIKNYLEGQKSCFKNNVFDSCILTNCTADTIENNTYKNCNITNYISNSYSGDGNIIFDGCIIDNMEIRQSSWCGLNNYVFNNNTVTNTANLFTLYCNKLPSLNISNNEIESTNVIRLYLKKENLEASQITLINNNITTPNNIITKIDAYYGAYISLINESNNIGNSLIIDDDIPNVTIK